MYPASCSIMSFCVCQTLSVGLGEELIQTLLHICTNSGSRHLKGISKSHGAAIYTEKVFCSMASSHQLRCSKFFAYFFAVFHVNKTWENTWIFFMVDQLLSIKSWSLFLFRKFHLVLKQSNILPHNFKARTLNSEQKREFFIPNSEFLQGYLSGNVNTGTLVIYLDVQIWHSYNNW